MKHSLIAALVVLVVVAVPLCLTAQGTTGAGKNVYDKKCAACHGKYGEGKVAIAKRLGAKMHHLGSKAVQAKTNTQLRREIIEGIGKMKPVKGLSKADLTHLFTYIRTLKQK